MIHVSRPATPPAFFASAEFRNFVDRLEGFQRLGGSRKLQRRHSFERNLRAFQGEALPALRGIFAGKCAYTEAPVDEAVAELTLHRPAADAMSLDGEVSPEHYWWEIAQWRNWYLAHSRLVATKGTQFPVLGQRAGGPPDNLLAQLGPDEPPDMGLLLDPCLDEPAWYLHFHTNGWVESRPHPLGEADPSQPRGEITLRCLDLNADWLVEERDRAAAIVVLELGELERSGSQRNISHELIQRLVSNQAPYAACRRQVVARQVLEDHERLSLELGEDQLGRLVAELSTEVAAYLLHHPQPLPDSARPAFEQVADRLSRAWPQFRDLPAYQEIFGSWTSISKPRKPSGTRGIPSLGTTRGLVDRAEAETRDRESPPTEQPFGVTPTVEAFKTTILRSATLTEVEIENFKAIHHLQIDFTAPPITLPGRYGYPDDPEKLPATGWKAFLGENGSGKSSVLQAIGLVLAGHKLEQLCEQRQIAWHRLLRRPLPGEAPVSSGFIRVRFTGDLTLELRFDAQGFRWQGGMPHTQAYVRGYGATRLLDSWRPGDPDDLGAADTERRRRQRNLELRKSVRLDNLFDPRAPVVDAESWLLGLRDEDEVGDFNVIATTLQELLAGNQPPSTDTPVAVGPSLVPDYPAGEILVDGVPLSQVSDGYRAVISMVCDILAGLGQGLSDLHNARGIVLIDELGAHLHPSWRMTLTEKLRRALPQVQFIVSTHEPLCLRGMVENEVVRVRKIPRRGVTAEVVERSPSAYRVDQLLTSEFFGLDTTIDPDLDRRFQAYYRLLALGEAERSKAQQAELESLRAYLQHHARPALGTTRRDQLVYEAIDQFLAAQGDLSPAERQRQRRQALGKVVEIWDRRKGGKGGKL